MNCNPAFSMTATESHAKLFVIKQYMKNLILLPFLFVFCFTYSQNSDKTKIGNYILNEVAIITNGHISKQSEGLAIITLSEYSSFDLVKSQISLLEIQASDLDIYRAWQYNIGTYQMIIKDKSGYLFMIAYSENKTNNSMAIAVIWDKETMRDWGAVDLFKLTESEFQ